jgi:tripartite-type tricarboxylate transporter receptor subunit TctC
MQFVKVAGIDMVHVPYRGNAPMLQALLANQVQLTFDTPTLASPHIQSGELTALAVTGDRRLPKLPNVPTVRETAQLDYSTDIWIFVLGPKGILEPVQTLLNKEIASALDDKAVRARLTGFGLEVTEQGDNTVANLKKHIDGFAATYGKLIAEAGIKAE